MLELYKSCYNLEAEPFRLSPDHRFSYAHRSYAHARSYLEYALSQGEGFIVITGEAGTGKTTLISDLLENMDRSRLLVVTLTSAQLDMEHLVMLVISSFGLSVSDNNIALLLVELKDFLVRLQRKGGRAILIMDEAQGLSHAALEELRLLSNLQHENRLLLQIFLLGQDGLLEKIQAPGMENLHQRIIASSRLEPLDLEETVAYLEYRLCQVGWKGDPAISARAIRIIHRFSGGIPRRINLIAHRLFLFGGIHQRHRLSGEDAKQVVEELRSERLLAGDVSTLSVPDHSWEDASSTDDELSLPRRDPAGGATLVWGGTADDAASELQGEVEAQASAKESGGVPPVIDANWYEPASDHDDDTAMEDSVPDNVGKSGASRRMTGESRQPFWPVIVLVMLLSMLLVISTNDDFRARLVGFVRLVLSRFEHDAVISPASALDSAVLPRLPEGDAPASGGQQSAGQRAGAPVAQRVPSGRNSGLQRAAFLYSWSVWAGGDLHGAVFPHGKSAADGTGGDASLTGTPYCTDDRGGRDAGRASSWFRGPGDNSNTAARYFPVTTCAADRLIPGKNMLANEWFTTTDGTGLNRQKNAARARPQQRSGNADVAPADSGAGSPPREAQQPPPAGLDARPAVASADQGAVTGKEHGHGGRKAHYLHALLQSGWLRDDEPVGYLPSLICDCSKQKESVTCNSNRQHKRVDGHFIRYITRSVIENITGSGTFRITYRHFIIDVDGHGGDTTGTASGERDDPAGEYPVRPGWGSRHVLQCRFTGDTALSCSKDTAFAFKLVSRNLSALDM